MTLALGYLLVAMFMALAAEEGSGESFGSDGRRSIAVFSAVALVVFSALPGWDVGNWTLGLYRLSTTRDYYADHIPENSPIIFHRDGLAATVTVEQDGNDGARWIKVDGKIDGSSHGDMPTQVLSGMLPLLINPRSENVAVIGCGSCVTIGAMLAASKQLKTATLIELEPAVIEGARLFGDVNHQPWNDPRLTIVEDDGRNFLRRRGRQKEQPPGFDLIVSEPSNPWMTGAASLFTYEFFTIAAAQLADDGAFVQWVQMYEMAPERIGSILKTFASVFPQVLVFSAHRDSNDLLLVGSASPIRIHWGTLAASFDRWRSDLAVADLHRPEDLIGLMLLGEKEIHAGTGGLELNTDDNALIEFGAPRDLVTYAEMDPAVDVVSALDGKRQILIDRYLSGIEDDHDASANADAVSRLQIHMRLANGFLRQGQLEDGVAQAIDLLEALPAEAASAEPIAAAREKLRVTARGLLAVAKSLVEDDPPLAIDASAIATEPRLATAWRLMLDDEEEQALEAIEVVEAEPSQSRSGPCNLLHGYLLYRLERLERAQIALKKAAILARTDANFAHQANTILYYRAKTTFNQGDYPSAVEQMTRFHENAKRLSGSSNEE